jgi:hypothetical protein
MEGEEEVEDGEEDVDGVDEGDSHSDVCVF